MENLDFKATRLRAIPDIAHELKVRPLTNLRHLDGYYVILDAKERDAAVDEIERLRAVVIELVKAYQEKTGELPKGCNVEWFVRDTNEQSTPPSYEAAFDPHGTLVGGRKKP